MRKAAGILMVILGTIMGTFVALVELTLGEGSMNYARFILVAIIPAVFVITGGVFCLKRKYWKLCFTSSLFFNYFVLLICALDIFPYVLTWFLAPVGIVPLIFTCLRKREWQEIQG